MGRPFLGSINALPAVAETMRARAEAYWPPHRRLGSALGVRNTIASSLPSPSALTAAIAENSINVHLPLELARVAVQPPGAL